MHPIVKQLQHYPGEMNMLSGIMMNLGNYPGDTASQEMIAKYKELHSAAERVANLTYQTEMARAQLQATHLEYMNACMNFEMRGNMGDAKEAKKREVAWKEQLEMGPRKGATGEEGRAC